MVFHRQSSKTTGGSVREDMAQLSVNMPRVHDIYVKNRKTRGKLDPNVGWDHQNTPDRRHTRPTTMDDKIPNDYMSPFHRFLRSSIGKIWNEVHSEIRSVTSHRTTTGHRLLKHLEKCVASNQTEAYTRYTDFFVDNQGFLRENRKNFYPESVCKKIEEIVLSKTVSLEFYKGFWFRVIYTKHFPGELMPVKWFAPGQPIIHRYTAITFEEASRRQLGKRELKEVRDILSAPRRYHHGNWKNPIVLKGKDQRNNNWECYCERKS